MTDNEPPDLVGEVERAKAKPGEGWYDDPRVPGQQRYWDGTEWTRASRPAAAAQREQIGLGLILAFAGTAAVVIGSFLPYIESPSLVPVQSNSLAQSGLGLLAMGLALIAVGAAWTARRKIGRNWTVIVMGTLVVLIAIYEGTGERLELVYGNGRTEMGSAGVGVYVVGVGGLGLLAAGFRED
jgi:hypothetical protein